MLSNKKGFPMKYRLIDILKLVPRVVAVGTLYPDTPLNDFIDNERLLNPSIQREPMDPSEVSWVSDVLEQLPLPLRVHKR